MSRPSTREGAVPARVSVLEPFVAAGVFEPAEVQLAATFARLQPDVADDVLLALALAARGPRLGHVCVEPAAAGRAVLGATGEDPAALPWPEPADWSAALVRSELVADPAGSGDLPLRPLVWDGRRLYLHRYWQHEDRVAERLLALAAAGSAGPPPAELAAALDLAFSPGDPGHLGRPDEAGTGSGSDDPRSALLPVGRPVAHAGRRTRPEDRRGQVEGQRGQVEGQRLASDGEGAPQDGQRLAAERALTNRISVIAGGPGTGKTRTVAGLLEAAHRLARWRGESLHVALAAPTGKAAARLAEAIGAAVHAGEAEGRLTPELAEVILANPPTTLHRLLGPLPAARFRHDEHRPLPHDLVVVDEASMVSLPLMSALLAAARPDARVVLVGDPDQLSSVEAGSVLRDVVGPRGEAPPPPTSIAGPTLPRWASASAASQASQASAASQAGAGCEGVRDPLDGRVTVLHRVHRFAADSAIATLAEAIRSGDADRAVHILSTPTAETAWIRGDDRAANEILTENVLDAAVAVVRAARGGDGPTGLRAAARVKVLSATRAGVREWSERIERGVAVRESGFEPRHRWYVGRPVMVTANDHLNQLANGDVGVVVAAGGRTQVALETGGAVRLVEPSRLGQVDTWWAMTIHKSQGSEFDHAVIALPDGPSPILSRELLYTAVTRARRRVTVIGNEACIREAVTRAVARASGLGGRLWQPESTGSRRPPAGGRRPTPGEAGIHQDGHTPPLPSRL